MNAFPELPSSTSSNNTKSTIARRIKPTQLLGSSAGVSGPLGGDEEIPCTPISRPFNTATVAWKKISTPLRFSFKANEAENVVDEETSNSLSTTSSSSTALLLELFNALPNRESLHELSLALHQIIFYFSLEEESRFVFNFASAIGALCKLLAVGEEVCLMQPSGKLAAFLCNHRLESAGVGGEALLASPRELCWVAAQCASLSARPLRLFFPDSLKQLHKNGLLSVFGFSEAFKTDSLASCASASASAQNDSLAVAYSNLRDSRNFFTDPTAHANQQRCRDLFLNLIRFHVSSTSTSTASNYASSRRGFAAKVAEITGRLVSGGSHAWMAELFLTEYLQVQETRIDRLEERIKGTKTDNDDDQEVFWLFLQQADSFKLTRAVEAKAIVSLTGLLEAANQRRSTCWSESVRKARFLARVIAFCRYRLAVAVGVEEDEEAAAATGAAEEDLLVFCWVRGAIEGKWMLTLLPCLFEYFSLTPAWGIKQR